MCVCVCVCVCVCSASLSSDVCFVPNPNPKPRSIIGLEEKAGSYRRATPLILPDLYASQGGGRNIAVHVISSRITVSWMGRVLCHWYP